MHTNFGGCGLFGFGELLPKVILKVQVIKKAIDTKNKIAKTNTKLQKPKSKT